MKYANWEKTNNLKKDLTKINLKKEEPLLKSGIPVIYDGDDCYITNDGGHTLIVGSTGSGKTQTMILPLIKLSLKASESLIVNDPRGELYKATANKFKESGYKVVLLDFDKFIYGESWNPLLLPYKTYMEGNKDYALKLLEYLSYYIFTDVKNNAGDPFWINSTCDYFTGLCLYLFKNAKEEEINLVNVYELSNKVTKDKENFMKKVQDDLGILCSLSGTLESPAETMGGIIATFNQKIKKYIVNENLSNMMLTSSFDITSINEEKVAIYIMGGYYDYGNSLIPLFINQVFETVNQFESHERRINVILDEFDRLLPIKDFAETINYSRSVNICYTVVIKSYLDLINTYGKENVELINLCFANIIYLLSNDIYTLNKISELCGNQEINNNIVPLITVEELKTIEKFEAIFLMIRKLPIKSKLTPDYKIDWGYTIDEEEIKKRKINTYKKHTY